MTESTRIEKTFADLKSHGQMAFMPFVTAGDPDMPTTLAVIEELGRRGVDLIEIGFPYSDPIADGPVIQAAYTRALLGHLHVKDIFTAIGSLDHEKLPPLVAMVSYAIVYRQQPEAFIAQAKQAGFSGLIIPDLPGDEAGDVVQLVRDAGLDLIQLISPTTPMDRAKKILQAASGFVYCISVAGTTGVRDQLPPELNDQLRSLREQTDLPLAVGFGISSPEQVDVLRDVADGVIVGSAIVRRLENAGADPSQKSQIIGEVGDFAAEMVAATHRS